MNENIANKIYIKDSDDKIEYQASLFTNRLSKQYKILRKWARKNRVTCFRLYDRDIPEVPLALDLYTFLPNSITTKLETARFLSEENSAFSENKSNSISPYSDDSSFEQDLKSRTYIHLYLYDRPYEKPEEDEKKWLSRMSKSIVSVLGIDETHIILKTRFILRSTKDEQYERLLTDTHIIGTVQEQGQLFKINLSDYIDTGLFFDHRPLRNIVRSSVTGKTVLNLFCYTGSFSVYAAEGKARSVESVDMSKTYLDWAQENLQQNEFYDENKYFFTRQDVIGFLNQKNAEVPNEPVLSKKTIMTDGHFLPVNRWDLIILDPPTFSNSKRTDTTLDITRDWISLCSKCINLLTAHGILYFSTNSRRLSFNEEELRKTCNIEYTITDITQQTIPEDYRNSKIHRCWKIVRLA